MANSLWELFVRVSGDNSGFKKSIKDSQGDLSGFEHAATVATDKIGSAFASLGLKMTGAGIGAFIFKTGSDFQAASNIISKATGQTGDALAGLNASFKSLYATSGRSSEEIAGGLAKIAVETKLTGDALQALTAANLRFAKVTSSDVGGAVEETQVVFKQFNVAAADQADALDVLYATMTSTGLGLSSLTAQMVAIGPVAKAFGMSFVETAALVGAFKEAGLNAAEAASGLQRAFSKWAAAGKDPKEALADLIEKMKSAKTTAEAVAIAIDAGFVRGMAVKMADAVRRGVFELTELDKKLTESKGKVKEVADKTSSFTDELKKLGHEASLVGGSVGEPIVKAFTDILAAIRKANDEFANFETKAKKWLSDKGFLSIIGGDLIGPVMKGVTGLLYPGWGSGSSSGPSLPKGPISTNLTTPPPGGGGGGGGDDLNNSLKETKERLSAIPFAQKGLEAAILVEQIHQLTAANSKFVSEVAKAGGLSPFHQKAAENVAAAMESLANPPSPDGLGKMSDALHDLLNPVEKLPADLQTVADAFDYFGEHTIAWYEAAADTARKNFEIMRKSGWASATALDRAFTIYKLHQIELDHELGITDDDLYASQKKNAEETLKKIEGATTETKTRVRSLGEELQQATHRMFDNISRSIARNLVEWKGWGESLKSILKTVAEDVLNILISTLLKPLEDKLAGMLGKIGGGGGGTPGIPGGGGGPGGGAGGAAGAASGVMGTIGAVSAAVGAVSSIVGNFQMAGMNKSLDVLVNHTLRTFNELAQFRADAWSRHTQWFTRSSEIWQAVLDVKDAIGRGGTGTGGKGGINFTNCSFTGSPNEIASAIFTQAQLAGAI